MTRRGGERFVGRAGPRGRLAARLRDAQAGRPGLVLVTGEAGIGKTALVEHALGRSQPTLLSVWGACWADAAAPGLWPWTQALNALVARVGSEHARAVAGDDAPALAGVVTALGSHAGVADTPQARLLLFDAVARWVTALAADQPIVIVLDDLHWADRSSLDLLDHVTRTVHAAPLLLVGTCRDDEIGADVRAVLAALTTRAEHIRLTGLSRDDVHALIGHLTSDAVADRFATVVHRRTGGRPFFVRELAGALDEDGQTATGLPASVRDVIAVRLARLSRDGLRTVTVAALLGADVRVDVVADVTNTPTDAVHAHLADAVDVGALVASPDGTTRFAHDLIRETLQAQLPVPEQRDLHARAAQALERSAQRGGAVAAAEIARHHCEAMALTGAEPALRWATAAADADLTRLALTEAAAHYQRVRDAATRAGVSMAASVLVPALVGEADALARAGDRDRAHQLLAQASTVARQAGDAGLLAAVAFGVRHLGARFAMPREPVITVLDDARQAAAQADDPALEARLTAALARELAHSIPAHRVRAGPLSQAAVALAEGLDDPTTELACLLARHDVLWTPGTGGDRLEITRRLVALAGRVHDDEQRAEALTLQANAQLETGQATFRETLHEALAVYDALGQPRHRYLALTRRAALALIDGDLQAAAGLSDEAAALGDRIGEPDAGNVHMSQRLALTQLRGDADEQRRFAEEAIRWWVGAPVHAHAVAAGFLARAGELDAARREVMAVTDLGGWHSDRSYLWSVYVSQLAEAAALLHDADLGRQILDDLRPVAGACGVNGAVVAFAGSLAQAAGHAAVAAGHPDEARDLFERAITTHARLGARQWEVLSRRALQTGEPIRSGPAVVTLRLDGGRWLIDHEGTTTSCAASKGWRDLAMLLAHPGVDVHVLQLTGAGLRQEPAGELIDTTAITAYRQRLRDVAVELAEADADNDTARAERLRVEHDALLDELGRATGRHGRPRADAHGTTERARKAVAARIRDAIRKLDADRPELAAHLDRSILTGQWCRYRPSPDLSWHVDG